MTLAERQRAICTKWGSPFIEADSHLKCGVAIKTIGLNPIYGVRYAKCKGTTGWYLWCGEYSDDPAFYDPVCTRHLLDYLPLVLPYLCLAPGYCFIIDANGYEDIWFEADFASRG